MLLLLSLVLGRNTVYQVTLMKVPSFGFTFDKLRFCFLVGELWNGPAGASCGLSLPTPPCFLAEGVWDDEGAGADAQGVCGLGWDVPELSHASSGGD